MSVEPASKISRERLNQIALRKLTTFGLSPTLDPARHVLVGEWPFKTGKLVAPGTQVRLSSARYQVEGHDHARFLAPPLAALEPVAFYDAESAEEFEQRVARALTVRMRYLQALSGQLEERRIPVRLDGNALALRGEVATTEHRFELLADPSGIRIVAMRPLLTGAPPTPVHFPLALEEHATRSELELFLAQAAQRGQLGLSAPSAAARAPATPRALPAAQGTLSAGLLQRFGADATLTVEGGRLEVSQTIQVGEDAYRFVAIHLGGPTFHGRLSGPGGDKWSDRFDLGRFPGVEELARISLNLPKPMAEAPTATPASGPAGFLAPVAEEVWVMSVLIEREVGGEVRYTCADLDGRPYGATRILGAEDFRATFSPHGTGWRLRIEIARMEGDIVVYRQITPEGLRSPEKRLPLATLTTVFLPEAQAY